MATTRITVCGVPTRRPLLGRVRAVACAAALMLLCAAGSARADDFVDQVNAGFKDVPTDRRSDLVLIPLLAKMQAPPGVLKSQIHAALLGSEGPGWEECAKWATGEAQKACLAALDTVTKERDHRKAYAFAQPYGVDGVDPEIVSTGLYTELGETPTLAGATFGVMPALENLGILAQVEASRRAKEGDVKGSIDLLVNWTMFARQFADRPFAREKAWALNSLLLSLVRIRDVAYGDYRAETHKLDSTYVKELLKNLPPEGYLSFSRMRPPEADSIARRQLINRVLKKTGGADSAFGPTMARISSVERPLRLFSASAYWETVGSLHKDYNETERLLTGITQDWAKRWDLSPFDPVQQTKSDYTLKVQGRSNLGLLTFGFEDAERMRGERQRCRAELAGTRIALAVYGYMLQEKTLPPALNSTRPSVVAQLDKDPYSSAGTDLQYMIVGRDNPKGADGQPRAYTIKIFPPDPYPTFEVSIQPGNFILYSVGPNNVKESVQEATQGREGVRGDYLLWPPALSLFRQREIDTNSLN